MQIQLYLTDGASPDATTELPADPSAAARGRNGWFCPHQIVIWRGEQIQLAVRSRRLGDSPPICLHISRPAAHALGAALLTAAADPAGAEASPTEPAVPIQVEVEWHPDYRGGDYDPEGGRPAGPCSDTGELTVIEVSVSPGVYVTDALVDAAFTAATGQDPIHIIRWGEVEEPVGGFRVCSVCGADIAFDPLDMHGCAHCQEPICPACAGDGHHLCPACA